MMVYDKASSVKRIGTYSSTPCRQQPRIAVYSSVLELPASDFELMRTLALATLTYRKTGGQGLPWRPDGTNGVGVGGSDSGGRGSWDKAAREVAAGVEEMEVAAVRADRVELWR